MDRTERRDTLLAAARRAFAAHGYDRTGVADIIESAGVARGTFYLYFPGKRAIFDELLRTFLDRVLERVQGVRTGPGEPPPAQQVRANIARVLDLLLRERELSTMVLGHAAGLDAEADRTLEAFHDRLAGALERALVSARALGLSSAEPRIAARILLGGAYEIARYMLRVPDPPAREAVVDELLRFWLKGVLGDAEPVVPAALPALPALPGVSGLPGLPGLTAQPGSSRATDPASGLQ